MTVPPLLHDDTFARDGIRGLLTPEGYKLAWTDYQRLLVQKLNELLAGERHEEARPKDLAMQFARDPQSASLFNHASMAHNNQFFFDGLAPRPQELDKCPTLKESLEGEFGGVDTLRATLLDTAAAMFGPGFVWLVWARNPAREGGTALSDGAWRVLTTYLAGTPYPEAGYRQQGVDMATADAGTYDAYRATQQRPVMNSVGSFGAPSAAGRKAASYPPGGTEVVPVLCVNTWEHVYLYDFGVGGKRRFLADWWACIDWHRVEQNWPQRYSSRMKFT